jgi:membrane-associated phospholipid phosphatase
LIAGGEEAVMQNSQWNLPTVGPYAETLCIPAVLIFHRLCYNLVGTLLSRGSTDFGPLLLTGLDMQIPYVPMFVLPYLFTWGYPGFILGYALFSRIYDHQLFRYFYLSALILTCTECLLWLLFPARISIRVEPEVLALHGWLGELTAYVYRRATPWNVIPSAHIASSYICWLFSAHFATPRHRWGFLVLFFLICLSVLFIKNHFLLDILGGMILGQLIYYAVFLPTYRYRLLHRISGTVMIAICCLAAALAVILYQVL